jgi:hypothetical protein
VKYISLQNHAIYAEMGTIENYSAYYCIFLQIVAILGSIGLQRHWWGCAPKRRRESDAFDEVITGKLLERLNLTQKRHSDIIRNSMITNTMGVSTARSVSPAGGRAFFFLQGICFCQLPRAFPPFSSAWAQRAQLGAVLLALPTGLMVVAAAVGVADGEMGSGAW